MTEQETGSRGQGTGKDQKWFAFPRHPAPGTSNRGFTLVEMIVAVGLFAIVMLVAIGALLSLTAANKKAQALQSVMNNLNIALDGMVRNIRMGDQYHCDDEPGAFVGDGTDDNCPDGKIVLTFSCNPDSSTCAPGGTRWAYEFVCPAGLQNGTCASGGYIARTEQDGPDSSWSTPVPITASEVDIQQMVFYVLGAKPGDSYQPEVIIAIQGTAGAAQVRSSTTFHIQTTAVQRELDL